MKKSRKRNFSIERWTIDRLDEDAGMARIVYVPMKESCLKDYQTNNSDEININEIEDHLSLWDLSNSRIRRIRISTLKKNLTLSKEEYESLSENMVFWILYDPGQILQKKVFHKTLAARQLAKEFYERALKNEGGNHETK